MKLHRMALTAVSLMPLSLPLLAQPVNNTHTVTVSVSGSGANYSNLSAALSSISDASPSNPYTILVYPGTYTGCNNGGFLQWKNNVSLKGLDRDSTIIKGSCDEVSNAAPLINFTDITGVEVSDITLDESAQMAMNTGANENGALLVCGASVVFNHVRIVNGDAEDTPGFVFNTVQSAVYFACEHHGSVIIRNSDVGPIKDGGGDWTILSSHIHGDSTFAAEYIYTYARVITSDSGPVNIIGSTVEANATVESPQFAVSPIYLIGEESVSAQMRIIGSNLIARNMTSSPAGVTAAVYEETFGTSGSSLLIDGSVLTYESGSGIGSGEFYGVYSPDNTSTPIMVRASAILSFGSGGTRADVYADSGSSVDLTTTQYSSFTGDGGTSTSDTRQGKFSADLVIPLTSPTLGPVNGQIWIDTGTNKLCYRSGGSTRCLTGT